jgi:putative tryptophan/tyrosine transport system substrate-binding protein
MRRRAFIAGLGTAVAWPVVAEAQQPAIPTIGYLAAGNLGFGNMSAFRNALAQSGFTEGRNVTVDYRIAQFEQLPELAADLVRRHVSLMFVSGIGAARAAKAETLTVPILFVFGEDPVQWGIVASLSRPGGNVTGISYFTNQLFGKRLGLLKEIVPHATTFALLVNPDNLNAEPDTKETQIAAVTLGLALHVMQATRTSDLEGAFAAITPRKIGGILVDADSVFLDSREQIAALAARHAVPAIYDRREFLGAGGLMSYGANPRDAFYQAGLYAARILKGEKPADLPVQQSTRFELVINSKTAKALGLTIPETLLATADEVIQ